MPQPLGGRANQVGEDERQEPDEQDARGRNLSEDDGEQHQGEREQRGAEIEDGAPALAPAHGLSPAFLDRRAWPCAHSPIVVPPPLRRASLARRMMTAP
ncbi:MAG: hypothetical protein R2712_18355 [Vicinamibacterales bacterium]